MPNQHRFLISWPPRKANGNHTFSLNEPMVITCVESRRPTVADLRKVNLFPIVYIVPFDLSRALYTLRPYFKDHA